MIGVYCANLHKMLGIASGQSVIFFSSYHWNGDMWHYSVGDYVFTLDEAAMIEMDNYIVGILVEEWSRVLASDPLKPGSKMRRIINLIKPEQVDYWNDNHLVPYPELPRRVTIEWMAKKKESSASGGYAGGAAALLRLIKGYGQIRVTLPCGCEPKTPYQLREAIIHLNDVDKWTRNEIADWLDTLDEDLTIAGPTEREDALAELSPAEGYTVSEF